MKTYFNRQVSIKIWYLQFYMALICILSLLAGFFAGGGSSVDAMGGTSVTINVDRTKSYTHDWWGSGTGVTLPIMGNATNANVLSGVSSFASGLFKNGPANPNPALSIYFPHTTTLSIPTAGISVGSISSATFTVKCALTVNNLITDSTYLVGFTGDNSQVTLDTTDSLYWDRVTALTNSISFKNATQGTNYTFTFNAAGRQYISDHWGDTSGFVRFVLIDSYVGGSYPGWDQYDDTEATFNCSDAGYTYLTLNYVPDVSIKATMVSPTNGSTGTPVTTGTVSGITWSTPRYAFNNEDIIFDVASATSYLTLSLNIEDAKGNKLLTTNVSDMIRSGTNAGHFYFKTAIPGGYTGFFRCVETSHGVTNSTWGYASAPMDTALSMQSIMVNDTNADFQDNSIDDYTLTKKGEIFKVYWRTDIGASDLSTAYLRLYYLGINYATNPAYTAYNNSFSNYKTLCGNTTANDGTLGVRYAIFTMYPSTGFDNRDGLIVDLNRDVSAAYWGFYQPVIWNNTAAVELTTTNSCLWYLQDGSTGFKVSNVATPQGKNTNSYCILTVAATSDTGVLTNLNSMTSNLYKPATTTAYHTNTYTLAETESQYQYVVGLQNGTWNLTTQFSKAGCSFIYYKNFPMEVVNGQVVVIGGGGGTGGSGTVGDSDLTQRIKDWAARNNAGSQGSHWLIVLAVMVVVMLIPLIFLHGAARTILAVLLPMVVLCAALAMGFIDPWLIILLGIVVAAIFGGIVIKQLSGSRG